MTRALTPYQVFRNESDPVGEASTLNLARKIAFEHGGDRIECPDGTTVTVPRSRWLPSAHAALLAAGRAPAPPPTPAEVVLPCVAACGVVGADFLVLGVARSQDDAEHEAGKNFPGVAAQVFSLLADEQAARIAEGERSCLALEMGHAIVTLPAQ